MRSLLPCTSIGRAIIYYQQDMACRHFSKHTRFILYLICLSQAIQVAQATPDKQQQQHMATMQDYANRHNIWNKIQIYWRRLTKGNKIDFGYNSNTTEKRKKVYDAIKVPQPYTIFRCNHDIVYFKKVPSLRGSEYKSRENFHLAHPPCMDLHSEL